MAYKGKYKPNHPEKYKGDIKNIVYRSSWERKFMRYCDNNKNVRWWSSEPFGIPYISPKDGKPHRYFPDFLISLKRGNKWETVLIEVKPLAQTEPPVLRQRKTNRYLRECVTYEVNKAKWKAAQKYCVAQGWKFMIMTEKTIC